MRQMPMVFRHTHPRFEIHPLQANDLQQIRAHLHLHQDRPLQALSPL